VSRTGLNTYTFVIEDMREFYGVAEGVEIEEISILFHDDGGNRAGRGDGGADIFIEVFPKMRRSCPSWKARKRGRS
jgi:hypothetical protein